MSIVHRIKNLKHHQIKKINDSSQRIVLIYFLLVSHKAIQLRKMLIQGRELEELSKLLVPCLFFDLLLS